MWVNYNIYKTGVYDKNLRVGTYYSCNADGQVILIGFKVPQCLFVSIFSDQLNQVASFLFEQKLLHSHNQVTYILGNQCSDQGESD